MEITLKKIKVYMALSHETICFTADVYIDGKKAGTAANHGTGGQTDIHAIKLADRQLIHAAEKYFAEQPAQLQYVDHRGNNEVPMIIDGQHISFVETLDLKVDKLIDKYVNDKEAARFIKLIEKHMADYLVVGIAGEEYSRYKFKLPLAAYTGPVREPVLIKNIQDLVNAGSINKTDKQILNTNIPENILNQITYA